MYNLPDRNLTGNVKQTKQDSGSSFDETMKSIGRSQIASHNYNDRRFKTTSDYLRTYTSYSGHDMVCSFEIPLQGGGVLSQIVGEVQTISYSIHNEKMPVRVLGDMNVKGFVFGSRTIAGSIVFTVFDRHWAQELINDYKKAVKADEQHVLSDEMPGINITISMANEYGDRSRLAIYHVTFVNEGQVMSINDVYTENTYQFFATDIDYLTTNINKNSSGIDNFADEVSNGFYDHADEINKQPGIPIDNYYSPGGNDIAANANMTSSFRYSGDVNPYDIDSDLKNYNDLDSAMNHIDSQYENITKDINEKATAGSISKESAFHARDDAKRFYFKARDELSKKFAEKNLKGAKS